MGGKNVSNKDLKAMIGCCTDFGDADLIVKKYTAFATDTERTAFLQGLFDTRVIHRTEENASTDYAAVLTAIIIELPRGRAAGILSYTREVCG